MTLKSWSIVDFFSQVYGGCMRVRECRVCRIATGDVARQG